MKTEIINTKAAPNAIGPYSQAIQYNGIIYTSGQIALTPSGEFPHTSIEEQSRQVLENLKVILESAGSSLDKVIKTTVFLDDMDNFAKMNEIYSQYFNTTKPARSTLAVKTLPKNAKVEIECVAYI